MQRLPPEVMFQPWAVGGHIRWQEGFHRSCSSHAVSQWSEIAIVGPCLDQNRLKTHDGLKDLNQDMMNAGPGTSRRFPISTKLRSRNQDAIMYSDGSISEN